MRNYFTLLHFYFEWCKNDVLISLFVEMVYKDEKSKLFRHGNACESPINLNYQKYSNDQ